MEVDPCGRASGGCFVAHRTAGCNDATCCHDICAQDSFCCTDEWDETCVEEAATLCMGAPPLPENNSCSAPATVTEGTISFSNVGATTDGPIERGSCANVEFGADIWYCYTASCTGVAIVGLCGSRYDTTVAVYNGCGCPMEAALACSDDDCLVLESRTTVNVTQGQQYMIRIGGFPDPATDVAATGPGTLTVICGPDGTNNSVCGPGNGDCMAAHGTRGCDDANCCQTVCGNDPTCCDVGWDDICAQEAAGLCGDGFPACGSEGVGACSAASEMPGCDNLNCCNAVCDDDPYCCIAEWDAACVTAAAQAAACQ
jgi:hypothetical protein